MVSATKVLLFTTGALAQNACQVAQDLKNLDGVVKNFASSIQNLDGGAASMIGFYAAETSVQSSLAKASADASAISGRIDSPDTNYILAIVTGALASDFSAVVTALETKKTAIPTNQYYGEAHQLSVLYTSASGLAGQLVSKAAPAGQAAASSASNALLSNIGRVTALFN